MLRPGITTIDPVTEIARREPVDTDDVDAPSVQELAEARSVTCPSNQRRANLFFQLVTSRYERASLVVTSNKPFGRWGEVFGDDVVAAAMIDRLVHHAEVIALKGDSYKDRDLGRSAANTSSTGI